MPKNILITLPFSGRGVGAGLANFNADISKALAAAGHDVKLLTMQVKDNFAATAEDHGHTKIVAIEDPRSAKLENLKADEGADRDLLYAMLLDKVSDEKLAPAPESLRLPPLAEWQPHIIIGHSRFSGPAAIKLKQRWYPKAQVVYFLHSMPIEGTILSGSLATGWGKILEEMEAMPDADIVAGVGPLLRKAALGLATWGAMSRLPQAVPLPRIFECTPGTDIAPEPVKPVKPIGNVLKLLLLGRADATIKGLGEVVAAVQRMRSQYADPKYTGLKLKVEVKVRGVPGDIPVETANAWVKYMQDIVDNRAAGPEQYDKEIKQYLADFEVFQQKYLAYREALPVYERFLKEYEQNPVGREKPQAPPKPKQPEQPFKPTASTEPSWVEILPQTKKEELNKDIRASHALIMPSYVEHFGLVPLEAAGHGIPVLVNQLSGAGQFLADDRMGGLGKPCIVPDAELLNDRAQLWADAFRQLYLDYEARAVAAGEIYQRLKHYTWAHTATALVAATEDGNRNWTPLMRTLVQAADGKVQQSENIS